jgi:hypothetical protein
VEAFGKLEKSAFIVHGEKGYQLSQKQTSGVYIKDGSPMGVGAMAEIDSAGNLRALFLLVYSARMVQ